MSLVEDLVVQLSTRLGSRVGIEVLDKSLTDFAARTQTTFQKLNAHIERTTSLIAAAAGAYTIATTGIIAASAQTASRTEVLDGIMRQVGKTMGANNAVLDEQRNAMLKMGITTQEASMALVRFMQNELKVADAAKLARAAQDMAVVSGENSSQAFATLTYAISGMNTMILRSYGMTKSLTQVLDDEAVTLGKKSSALTEIEKKQALYNYIMKYATTLSGSYEESQRKVAKLLTSFPRYFEEARNKIGEAWLPLWYKIVRANADMLESFNKLDKTTIRFITGFAVFGLGLSAFTITVIGLTKSLGGVLLTLVKLWNISTLFSLTKMGIQLFGVAKGADLLGKSLKVIAAMNFQTVVMSIRPLLDFFTGGGAKSLAIQEGLMGLHALAGAGKARVGAAASGAVLSAVAGIGMVPGGDKLLASVESGLRKTNVGIEALKGGITGAADATGVMYNKIRLLNQPANWTNIADFLGFGGKGFKWNVFKVGIDGASGSLGIMSNIFAKLGGILKGAILSPLGLITIGIGAIYGASKYVEKMNEQWKENDRLFKELADSEHRMWMNLRYYNKELKNMTAKEWVDQAVNIEIVNSSIDALRNKIGRLQQADKDYFDMKRSQQLELLKNQMEQLKSEGYQSMTVQGRTAGGWTDKGKQAQYEALEKTYNSIAGQQYKIRDATQALIDASQKEKDAIIKKRDEYAKLEKQAESYKKTIKDMKKPTEDIDNDLRQSLLTDRKKVQSYRDYVKALDTMLTMLMAGKADAEAIKKVEDKLTSARQKLIDVTNSKIAKDYEHKLKAIKNALELGEIDQKQYLDKLANLKRYYYQFSELQDRIDNDITDAITKVQTKSFEATKEYYENQVKSNKMSIEERKKYWERYLAADQEGQKKIYEAEASRIEKQQKELQTKLSTYSAVMKTLPTQAAKEAMQKEISQIETALAKLSIEAEIVEARLKSVGISPKQKKWVATEQVNIEKAGKAERLKEVKDEYSKIVLEGKMTAIERNAWLDNILKTEKTVTKEMRSFITDEYMKNNKKMKDEDKKALTERSSALRKEYQEKVSTINMEQQDKKQAILEQLKLAEDYMKKTGANEDYYRSMRIETNKLQVQLYKEDAEAAKKHQKEVDDAAENRWRDEKARNDATLDENISFLSKLMNEETISVEKRSVLQREYNGLIQKLEKETIDKAKKQRQDDIKAREEVYDEKVAADKWTLDEHKQFIDDMVAASKEFPEEMKKWTVRQQQFERKVREESLEEWKEYYNNLKLAGMSAAQLNAAINAMIQNNPEMTQTEIRGWKKEQRGNIKEEIKKGEKYIEDAKNRQDNLFMASFDRRLQTYGNDYKAQKEYLDKTLETVKGNEALREQLLNRRIDLEKKAADFNKSAYDRFYDELFDLTATAAQKDKYRLDKEMEEYKLAGIKKEDIAEIQLLKMGELYKKYADGVVQSNDDMRRSYEDTTRTYLGFPLVSAIGDTSRALDALAGKLGVPVSALTSEAQKDWKKFMGYNPRNVGDRERSGIASRAEAKIRARGTGKEWLPDVSTDTEEKRSGYESPEVKEAKKQYWFNLMKTGVGMSGFANKFGIKTQMDLGYSLRDAGSRFDIKPPSSMGMGQMMGQMAPAAPKGYTDNSFHVTIGTIDASSNSKAKAVVDASLSLAAQYANTIPFTKGVSQD